MSARSKSLEIWGGEGRRKEGEEEGEGRGKEAEGKREEREEEGRGRGKSKGRRPLILTCIKRNTRPIFYTWPVPRHAAF